MSLKVISLLALLFIALPSAYALTVDSYNPLRNRVIFKGSESDCQGLNPGYRLTLNISESTSCDLEVLEVKKDQLIADSSLCAERQNIKAGQIAYKAGSTPTPEAVTPEAQTPQAPEPTVSAINDYRFAFDLGLTYSTDNKYDTRGKIRGAITENFTGSFDTESAMGILLGFTYKKSLDLPWFVSGGLQVDFTRKLKSQSISTSQGSATVNYMGNVPKATYVSIYGNFNYEVLEPLYVLAGIGYGSLAFSNFQPEIEGEGGYQAQAGLGVHLLNEHIYLEAVARYHSSSATRKLPSGERLNYENISAFGVLFSARYSFH